MQFDSLLEQIIQQDIDHRPVLIAIEGFGGAGKSTLAKELKNRLGDAFVVSIDDLIIKDLISDGEKLNFDRKRLERQVLLPLKQKRAAAYQKLIWDKNILSDFIQVPDITYLIVEGVSTSHPDIISYFDYNIYVDFPSDLAMERGRIRDRKLGNNNDELWKVWTKTYADYKQKYHPELKANFVYDNSKSLQV